MLDFCIFSEINDKNVTLHYLGTQNVSPNQLEPELTSLWSPTLIARVHARADAYDLKYKYRICKGWKHLFSTRLHMCNESGGP